MGSQDAPVKGKGEARHKGKTRLAFIPSSQHPNPRPVKKTVSTTPVRKGKGATRGTGEWQSAPRQKGRVEKRGNHRGNQGRNQGRDGRDGREEKGGNQGTRRGR